MTSTLSHFMVKICGESYDIYARRFEQDKENLPGIAAFYRNFLTAVLATTKSNVLHLPPRNYIHGSSLSDKLLGHRMQSTPYPWNLGTDANGLAFPNPPPPTHEDSKTWAFLQEKMDKQEHEDMKVLQMLWNWIGDYRRHTLTFIYNDPLLPTREKIAQMIARHKICLGASANIIINRYKSQWTDKRINICNDLETALKNYHLLQNINECIKDLDPAQIFTPTQIITELIPTLHNHQFAPVIKHWNHTMTQRLPLLESSVQPAPQ